MIKWKFNSLMGEVEDRTGKHYSVVEIAQEVGVNQNTISRIGGLKTARIDLETLAKLIHFFRKKLEREIAVGDLLKYEGKK